MRTLGGMTEPKDGLAKAGILTVAALVCAAQGYWLLAGIGALAGVGLATGVVLARRAESPPLRRFGADGCWA
jgi:hypothetical protein